MRYQGQKRTYSKAQIASIAAAIGYVFAGGAAIAEDAKPAGATNYKVAEFKVPRPMSGSTASPVVPVSLPPPQSVAPTIDPDRVLVIQSALVAKGCYDGALDAQWNDSTRRVVARAVRLLNLAVDARNPNDELVEALLRPQAGDCLSVVTTRAPDSSPLPSTEPAPAPERSLADVIAASRTTEIGSSSSLINQDPSFVTALQAALVAQNCFSGAIDGRWSNRTWSALMTFAKTTGVSVSDATIDNGLIDTVLSYPSTACKTNPDARSVEKRPSSKRRKALANTRKSTSRKRRNASRRGAKSERRTVRHRRNAATKRRTARLNRRNRSSGLTVRVGRSRGPAVFIRPVGVGRF
ncbi:MAG: hypothetical protein JXQ99_20770 [Hyphomicrobiaceae bacterium]